jgi:hypothetical protein
MSAFAQVITLDFENPQTAQLEREYAVTLEIPEVTVVVMGEQGPPGVATISADPDNRLTYGTDGKLFVADTLNPDPLMYYILARS